MIPDERDRPEHPPEKIRTQFTPALERISAGSPEYAIGAVPRPDFYSLVQAPSEILKSVGVSPTDQDIRVNYIKTFSTEPYGDLALLVSPR